MRYVASISVLILTTTALVNCGKTAKSRDEDERGLAIHQEQQRLLKIEAAALKTLTTGIEGKWTADCVEAASYKVDSTAKSVRVVYTFTTKDGVTNYTRNVTEFATEKACDKDPKAAPAESGCAEIVLKDDSKTQYKEGRPVGFITLHPGCTKDKTTGKYEVSEKNFIQSIDAAKGELKLGTIGSTAQVQEAPLVLVKSKE